MKKNRAQDPCIKGLIICADDYAQNTAISEGVLRLAEERRINAISCLVNAPCWGDTHQALHSVKARTFIGLHVNLTFGQPLSAMWRIHEGEQFEGLPQLLLKTHLQRLDIHVVIAEIQAQIDVFTHTMQCYPDFIDGHQHIHQLPVIREALFAVYAGQQSLERAALSVPKSLSGHALGDESPCFFRNTSNGWRDFVSMDGMPKSQLIALLGGRAFKRCLRERGILTNTSFAGIYQFNKARHYRTYFKRFLKKSKDGGLIMCHPGLKSQDRDDPLYLYRHHEWNYLMNDVFLSDLEDNAFQLIARANA